MQGPVTRSPGLLSFGLEQALCLNFRHMSVICSR